MPSSLAPVNPFVALAALAPLVAFGVAAAAVAVLAHPSWGLPILDHPNERSLHERPTPRTGGIGIVAGLVAGLVAALLAGSLSAASGGPLGGALAAVLLGAAAVAAVSFADDLRPLPPAVRLVVHVGAAGGLEAVFAALALREGWISPSVGFETRDESIPFAPLTEVVPVVRRHALSTSLAFGGNNAAFVLARAGGTP